MVWACLVQLYIYRKSECGSYASGTRINPATGQREACPVVAINVWAQTGSYVLIALSEIFTSITSLEYAYSKAPRNMRSMVQALALFAVAFAAAIGQAFSGLSADPLLVWNYAIIAILAAVGGCLYWLQFRALDKEEDALNELPAGNVAQYQQRQQPKEGESKA